MRSLRYVVLLLLLTAPAVYSHAQVVIGVHIGPDYGFYNPPPVCEWGYYPYYPYACAPYGYWGPEWFVSGVFIGAGPWYHFYYLHPGLWVGFRSGPAFVRFHDHDFRRFDADRGFRRFDHDGFRSGRDFRRFDGDRRSWGGERGFREREFRGGGERSFRGGDEERRFRERGFRDRGERNFRGSERAFAANRGFHGSQGGRGEFHGRGHDGDRGSRGGGAHGR
jgi:hypothetical protein